MSLFKYRRFVLFCPVTKMYFCDEPYFVLQGREVLRGCAVKSSNDATAYDTKELALKAQKKNKEYPEIIEL